MVVEQKKMIMMWLRMMMMKMMPWVTTLPGGCSAREDGYDVVEDEADDEDDALGENSARWLLSKGR